jgi:hypothetical protein
VFASAHHSLTELNITPLLDLAFVLLVIFIITTIPPVKDLDLKLPTASKHLKDPPRKANYITVQADGKMYLNKKEFTSGGRDALDAHRPARGRPGFERHRARRRQDEIQTNPRRAGCLPAGQRAQGGSGHRNPLTGNNHAAAHPARKKRNSSRVNFLISFTFHATLALVVLYFAARQGWLGKQAQKIFPSNW